MIGTRGHDLGGIMSAEELAITAKEKGFEAVQLVTYRSLDGFHEKPGFLTTAYAQKIGRAFYDQQVRIGLLGCYINLPHADLDRFKEYIAMASSFGCAMVGTETGSVNPDYSFNPENHSEAAFLNVVGIIKELVDYAEKFGVFVGIEAVASHIIHTPEKMQRMLKMIDSPNLKVIFDPVNLVTAENHEGTKAMIEDVFKRYGERINLIHAKDYDVVNGQIVMVPIGQGRMDYDHFYGCLIKYKYDIDVIIEDYRGQDLEDSRDFLMAVESRILG